MVERLSTPAAHFELQTSDLKVTGFLGTPQLGRRSKSQQFIYINHRPITALSLSKVIKSAYSTLLDSQTEPAFVLHLQLDPSQIDVNVHPRKEHVLLSQEPAIKEALHAAIKQTLATYDLTYQIETQPMYVRDSGGHQYDPSQFQATKASLQSTADVWKPGKEIPSTIEQIHQTYLALETPEGLLLIDQHAAHERILYQEYTDRITQQLTPQTHQLATPLILETTAEEYLLLQANQAVLQQIGFELEDYGGQSFAFTAVPLQFKSRNLTQLLKQVLDDLREDVAVQVVNHKVTAYLACRGAVKAGDFLTPDQRHSLVSKLFATDNRYTCPHGRPTMITISKKDLETMFKRRQ